MARKAVKRTDYSRREERIGAIMPWIKNEFMLESSPRESYLRLILENVFIGLLTDDEAERFRLNGEGVEGHRLFIDSCKEAEGLLCLYLENYRWDEEESQFDWQECYSEIIPFEGWLTPAEDQPLAKVLSRFGCEGMTEFVSLVQDAINAVYHGEGPETIGLFIDFDNREEVRDPCKVVAFEDREKPDPYQIVAVYFDKNGYEKDRFIGERETEFASSLSVREKPAEMFAYHLYSSYHDLLEGFAKWCEPHQQAIVVSDVYSSGDMKVLAKLYDLGILDGPLKMVSASAIPEVRGTDTRQFLLSHGMLPVNEGFLPIDRALEWARVFHYWVSRHSSIGTEK